MGERLHVLYLTHHGPWPASSGGRLRDAALVPELARLADVEVWAVTRTPDLDREWSDQGPAGVPVRVFADDGPCRRYPTRTSAAASTELRRRTFGADGFDVIHIEGHYLFHILPEGIRNRAVVVEHNVESHLLRQRAAHHGATAALAADIDAVVKAEEQVWREAPLVLTLSEEDRARVLHRVPSARVEVSTNGADHLPLTGPGSGGVPPEPRLGFLANYKYPPNRDALSLLLDDMLPALRRRMPSARLVLAGSGLHEALSDRRLPAGVDVLGWVEDVSRFWAGLDVALCPLRIGGGVKVKVIEAVRSGTLVVSTTVGVEGLPPAARDAVVTADSTEEFVDATVRLSVDPTLRRHRRSRLARAQHALPSWETVARSLYRHWCSVDRAVVGGVIVG